MTLSKSFHRRDYESHTQSLFSFLYCSDLYLCSIETRFSWMRAQSKQDVDTLRNFITKRIVTITMKWLALATVLLGKVCSLHLPPLVIQLKSNSHKPTTLASVPVVRLSASYANWMLTCVLHTHTQTQTLSFFLSHIHSHFITVCPVKNSSLCYQQRENERRTRTIAEQQQ